MKSANVVEVGEADFESRVVQASKQTPVVVDFWAGWCRPCLVLGPILERLAGEYEGRFLLAKVDVDANPTLASRFGVQGIPAVKAFVDGGVSSEFVGAQPEEAVRRFLDQVTGVEADARRAAAQERLRDLAARDGQIGEVAAAALEGRHRDALERCLDVVRSGGDQAGPAREAMLEIFGLLGDDHALTREYRSLLASALF
ncbi:MAG TPA: tetratricopeptide repeat protein [Actinomycetota bacterium]|nr:tetratricopeptide repeat protein [Actinomycetota bacterium]